MAAWMPSCPLSLKSRRNQLPWKLIVLFIVLNWKLLVQFLTHCAIQAPSAIMEITDIATVTLPETFVWHFHFPPLSRETLHLLENLCTPISSLLSVHLPPPTIRIRLRNSLFFLKLKGTLFKFEVHFICYFLFYILCYLPVYLMLPSSL